MWMTQCAKAGSVVVAGATLLGGAGLVGQTETVFGRARAADDGAPALRDVALHEVARGPLVSHVTAKGILESPSNYDVFCEVEWLRSIVHLVRERTQVKKGDIVCRLDSTLLRTQLLDQEIKTRSAEAAFLNAKLTRERLQSSKREDIEVKQALADEESKRVAWERERKAEAKLTRQIARCTIAAPIDGVVFYANDPAGAGRPGQIEVGALVRERQKLFRVVDLTKRIQVNVKVRESDIGKISLGLKANAWVEAFPNQVLSGTVQQISRFALPANFREPAGPFYPVIIKIADRLKGWEPGMPAWVEIPVTRQDVLSVPLEAVVRYDNTDHVAVKLPNGKIEWRAVKLGLANEKVVEVQTGLEVGEHVVLTPLSLMTEEEKKQKLGGASLRKPPARAPGK